MNRHTISILVLAFATSIFAFAAQAAEVKNIVIVHGALADGSGWRKASDNGRKNVGIGPASTDISGHALADLRIGDFDPSCQIIGDVARNARPDFVQNGSGRSNLSGCAVATLEAVVLQEGLLHRIEIIRPANSFNHRHLVATMHDGEAKTGVYAAAVDGHGASTTLAVIAALLRPRQLQMFSQRIKKRRAVVELQLLLLTVDYERNARLLRGHRCCQI